MLLLLRPTITTTTTESDARSAAAFSLFLRSERHPAGREYDLKTLSGFVFRVLEFPPPLPTTAAAAAAADRTVSFLLSEKHLLVGKHGRVGEDSLWRIDAPVPVV